MRNKVALAVSTALMTATLSTSAQIAVQINKTEVAPPLSVIPKNKKRVTPISSKAVFTPESGFSQGKHRYFVRLIENPVALYEGSIPGFAATFNQKVAGKLNVKSSAVTQYRALLNNKQNDIIQQAQHIIDASAVKQRTTLAYNGFVIEMSQAQATEMAKLAGIAHIKRETLRYPTSDAGPAIIKAPSIWDGSANGSISQGEGKIIGIIDTGINTDNPSFADIGGDDYDHTNPWGTGVYSGDCATEEFKDLCNDKLIGVHSYPEITDQYSSYDPDVALNGEDHNGHGSHTAGTSAGNILFGQNLPNVDGQPSGVEFEQMSGVAPHANIVSYQVCLPGEGWDSIGFAGCFPSLTVKAVEHAIENGVDALNYSIGGGSSDPWQDADSLAFLSARKAGIHVATSAGNSGPGPETVGSPGDAPWITTVAAYTHDRIITENALHSFSGGDSALPTTISGLGITGGFTGGVVYAANYPNENDPEGDPAQCLEPYPADTFPVETIVVCDRGAIARVDKGRNVLAGGASGLILANIPDGATSLADDAHVLPAIHINAFDGEIVRDWLASGENHIATIKGRSVDSDPSKAKIAADFTSRGPNASVPNVIKPSIAAPGVDIYAAYADDQSAGFKQYPDPKDFEFLSGTSMASPHIAGALTLLADIHPEWTPAQVQSAIMLTADTMTTKEDGITPSDYFDMGAGFANLEAAAQSGLVMDETFSGYMQANPALGGFPENINLASMANASCVGTCTWQRTVTATQDATWNASTAVTDGLALTVSPNSFTLEQGQSQTLTITADVNEASSGWNFAGVVLSSSGLPNAKLPVAVKAGGDNLPNAFTLYAQRNEGSVTFEQLKSDSLSDVKATVYDKVTQLIDPVTLAATHEDYDFTSVTFDENLPNVIFSSTNSTSPDFDLFVYDVNWTLIGSSAYAGSEESVSFTDLPAGTYNVLAYNYQSSGEDVEDTVDIYISSILFNDESISSAISTTVTDNGDDFALTFDYNSNESINAIILLSNADDSHSQQHAVNLTRGANDVIESIDLSQAMTPGETQTVTLTVAANFSEEDRAYTLTAKLPEGHQTANISHLGEVSGDSIIWQINREQGQSADPLEVSFDFTPRKAGNDYAMELSSSLNGDNMSSIYAFGVQEVAPVAMIDAPSTIKEGKTLSLNAGGSYDANLDAIVYNWLQLEGPKVSYNNSGENLSFKAPVSAISNTLRFQLTVTDSNGNSHTTISTVTVEEKDSGGSFAWLMLLMTPLLWLRRRNN